MSPNERFRTKFALVAFLVLSISFAPLTAEQSEPEELTSINPYEPPVDVYPSLYQRPSIWRASVKGFMYGAIGGVALVYALDSLPYASNPTRLWERIAETFEKLPRDGEYRAHFLRVNLTTVAIFGPLGACVSALCRKTPASSQDDQEPSATEQKRSAGGLGTLCRTFWSRLSGNGNKK